MPRALVPRLRLSTSLVGRSFATAHIERLAAFPLEQHDVLRALESLDPEHPARDLRKTLVRIVAGRVVEISSHAGLWHCPARSLSHSPILPPPLISSFYFHRVRGVASGIDALFRNRGEKK